jgi:pyruvate formate lyase activating enzyme
MYKSTRCTGSKECAKVCPKEAIEYGAEGIRINRRVCDTCGKCTEICPTEALKVVGKQFNVEDMMKEIVKDTSFFSESNGGITVSGGEPLQQVDFLQSILKECKDRSIHTAVDTCGYAPAKFFERISDKTDLFLYDIKIMNEKRHKKYTGVSNSLILENLKRLAKRGNNILARFPLIPEINDDEENIRRTAEFLLSCGVKHLSLLPYHRAGIEKYKGLNRGYRLKNIQSPSDENLNAAKRELESLGLTVTIGGG